MPRARWAAGQTGTCGSRSLRRPRPARPVRQPSAPQRCRGWSACRSASRCRGSSRRARRCADRRPAVAPAGTRAGQSASDDRAWGCCDACARGSRALWGVEADQRYAAPSSAPPVCRVAILRPLLYHIGLWQGSIHRSCSRLGRVVHRFSSRMPTSAVCCRFPRARAAWPQVQEVLRGGQARARGDARCR